jgi:hypothetical protein
MGLGRTAPNRRRLPALPLRRVVHEAVLRRHASVERVRRARGRRPHAACFPDGRDRGRRDRDDRRPVALRARTLLCEPAHQRVGDDPRDGPARRPCRARRDARAVSVRPPRASTDARRARRRGGRRAERRRGPRRSAVGARRRRRDRRRRSRVRAPEPRDALPLRALQGTSPSATEPTPRSGSKTRPARRRSTRPLRSPPGTCPIPSRSQAAASARITRGTVSVAGTRYHASAMRPSSSTRNAERINPRVIFPYVFLSPQAPHASATA